MTQPQPDLSKFGTGLSGWNHLTQVLGIWIPARLKITANARQGIRKLRTGR